MFEIKGREAQWKTIYREVRKLPVGTIVTLEELIAMVPAAQLTSVRPAFYRALKEMEYADSRTFVTVRGVGYRVAEAKEHHDLAKRQQLFAKRRIDVGLRKAAAADRTALTPDERQRLDALEHHLRRQQSFMRQLANRTTKVEQRVEEVAVETIESSLKIHDRVDQLYKLLKRAGIDTEDTAAAARAVRG